MAWFDISLVMRSQNRSTFAMEFPTMEHAYDFFMRAIDNQTSIVSVAKENSLVINGRDISSALITERP